MELGIYSFGDYVPDPPWGQGISVAQRFANLLEEIELADQVGLDVFALGEHHRPDFIVSSPATVLAAAAVRTKTNPAGFGGHRAQFGRSGTRVPAVRHGGSAVERTRRADGRPRLVHRVVPPVRLRTRRLRGAVHRKARSAAGHTRVAAGDVVGKRQVSGAADGARGVAASHPGPAAGVHRRGWQPRIGRAGGHAGPAAVAGHHRRRARAVPALRRSVPRGRQGSRAFPRNVEGATSASTASSPTPTSTPPSWRGRRTWGCT